MTEVTTYKCDYCGEEFEFEDDCVKHEREHVENKFYKHIIMLDVDGNILSGFDESMIEASFYICAADANSFNDLADIFEEYGYTSPRDFFGQPKSYPVCYAYNDITEEWLNIQQEVDAITTMLIRQNDMLNLLASNN